MSEFELLDLQGQRHQQILPVLTRHTMGDGGIPIFEIHVGVEQTTFQPPGWKEVEKVSKGPFRWEDKNSQLLWNDFPILKAAAAPTLRATSIADLPGLLARPEDRLPESCNQRVDWRWCLPEEINVYGLGQRSGPLERRGLSATNWTTDEPTGHNRTTDPLYQAHPILWGVTGPCWWAFSLCHTAYSRFDVAQFDPSILQITALGSALAFQVHCASSPSDLLGSLRQVLATPQRPPLWALGFHQSRWGYKTADEVSTLIDHFREKELPLDVIHLDIDHMDDYRSFTFDPKRFPDPNAQLKQWKEKGVRTVTIVDPGLKFDPRDEIVIEGLKEEHFIKSPAGAPFVGYCWPDEALFPDFARSQARAWWAQCCQFYLQNGVEGLWIDMNEPAIFDRPFWTNRVLQQPMPLDTPVGEDDTRSDQTQFRNLYGSLMSLATEQAWEPSRTRPWVLTRSGFSGVGAHAWSWMGDNSSWWEHLALSLPQLSSMSLVNSGFTGVDIGGFFGHCTGELYAAWIEASVIYPFMRAHSALGTAEQHPWSFGEEVEATAKKALQLRYQLLPYLYSASLAYIQGSDPVLRPMFFDYPQENEFRCLEDQVLFGPHMMAAPFLKRGEQHRLVIMPPGEWFDFHTGLPVTDRRIVVRRCAGLLPLFVKGGAVIPTFEETFQSTQDCKKADWCLKYFPSDSTLTTEIYWDDGETLNYRNGETVHVVLENSATGVSVTQQTVPPAFASLWDALKNQLQKLKTP